MRSLAPLILLVAAAGLAAALQPIEAVGNKFFRVDDGTQFYIKGVAYQLTSDDPLMDADQCGRDAALMKELGTNAIRVYHVDPTANHDGCMSVFSDAGIYVLLDLDTFTTYILARPPSWDQVKHGNYSAVMDAFAGYNNTLAFFVGNENIAQKSDSVVAPFLKAAARDMKAYRDRKRYRNIPIGYSAADIAELRPMLQNYLTCGGNASENVDFFSLNSYSWCDPSTYQVSDYAQLEDYGRDFPVPIFFSETGCNTPGPRLFADQDAIFGDQMAGDWSGAIVYEWIYEVNKYGLIGYGSDPTATVAAPGAVDGYLRQGTPVPKQPDFANLSNRWKTLSPTGVARSDYDPAHVSTRPCPTSTSDGWWLVDGNVALPTLGETYSGSAFSESPTATGSPPGATGGPGGDGGGDGGDDGSHNEGVASVDRHITGVAAGLVAVILLFTVWM